MEMGSKNKQNMSLLQAKKSWFWKDTEKLVHNVYTNGDIKKAAYEIGIKKAYGIDCAENLEEAFKYLVIAQEYTSNARIEVALRILFDLPYNTDFTKTQAIETLIILRDLGDKLAQYIYSNLLDEDLIFEDLLDKQDDELECLIKNIPVFVADFYLQINEQIKARFWYEKAFNDDNYFVISRYGNLLLQSSELELRKKGIEILKQSDFDEDVYIVAKAYLDGKIKERNFSKAYSILNPNVIDAQKTIFEKAKLYYFGWGCRADKDMAIHYFERYIRITLEENSPEYLEHNPMFIRAIGYLTECYFESLVADDNTESLFKLDVLARYHRYRRAQQLLYHYYADSTNFYRDSKAADSYYKMIIDDSMIDKNFILNGDDWKRKNLEGILAFSLRNFDEALLLLQDYLVYLDKSEPLTLLIMARMFSEHPNQNSINLLRAEIHLFEYLEKQQPNTDYCTAIYLLYKILDSTKKIDKLVLLLPYVEKAEVYNINIYNVKKVILGKLIVNCRDKDRINMIKYLEKAVDCGMNFDYSIIGIAYVIGKQFGIPRNYRKGFYWLKRFYDDYLLNKITCETNNIAKVEVYLGVCYFEGLGTSCDLNNADKLWTAFIADATENEADLLYTIANFYLEDDIDTKKGWKHDKSKAFIAMKKAAKYGNKDALEWLKNQI